MKSTTKLLDSTLSDNSVYIYDMMGNLQTKTGTGTAVTFGYDENGSLVSLRTDIMLDGRKELERRTSFAGSGSSVTEYSMLYGSGSVLGRRLADGTSEWYVKDRQGSLVMSVVNNGLGTALVYEPFGFQRLLYASGNEPAEQYTGKEYDGRLGLTYFGARYFDPSFALWLTPDPARQYLNPYSYGGDPVNGVDRDGRWSWKKLAAAVIGGSIGVSIFGEMTENGDNWYKVNRWDWSDIAQSAANQVGIASLGGPVGASDIITPINIVRRMCYDPDHAAGIFRDALWGGFFMDRFGNILGLTNAMIYNGTADDKEGIVVYSGGAVDYFFGDNAIIDDFKDSHGAEFFGHALFVDDRNDKATIAHEIDHVRQMERNGARIESAYDYIRDNGWSLSPNSKKYHTNPREMDAFYHQFLYEQGCIDIYGNRRACLGMGKDEWTHEQLSDMFYNGYGHKDETGEFVWDRVGYRYHKGVEDEYGDNWTWQEDWWLW